MTKVPVWPGAAEWAADLVARLSYRADVYEAELDVALRRNKSAAMVGDLAMALLALPGATTEMIIPLKDMLIFSEDMDNGVRHPWSKPMSGGTSIESYARTELRRWAVVAVLALRDAGVPAKTAYMRVATALVTSGRTVTWRGIQGWVRAFDARTDRRLDGVASLYQARWADVTCPHGQRVMNCATGVDGKCALISEIASRFTTRVATIPHLRDRFEP